MKTPVRIEGDHLEGGGQILRSSVALSAATGRAFVIENIRRRRKPPGLKAQHLAAVRLVADLCGAEIEGAEVGSTRLGFRPGPLRSGTFGVDIGTAGSITLLCQGALLPALMAPGPVRLRLTGGTDVRWSPPADYLEAVLLPYYRMLGSVRCEVKSRGFYPRGGGEIRLEVNSPQSGWDIGSLRAALPPLVLEQVSLRGSVHLHSLATEDLRERRVAERQARAARETLEGCPQVTRVVERVEYVRSRSTGTVAVAWLEQQCGAWPLRIAADTLGERGVPAEKVGARLGSLLAARLSAPAPVEEHLGDNLVPLLAAAGGSIRCQEVTLHALSNAYVVERFTGIACHREGNTLSVPR